MRPAAHGRSQKDETTVSDRGTSADESASQRLNQWGRRGTRAKP